MCTVVLPKGLRCPTWIWLGMCVPLSVCGGPVTLILWGMLDMGEWTQPRTWHQSRELYWEWGREGQAYVSKESNPVHPHSLSPSPLGGTCLLHQSYRRIANWTGPIPALQNQILPVVQSKEFGNEKFRVTRTCSQLMWHQETKQKWDWVWLTHGRI